ncbi:hypothetical protein X907_2551 [Glycocaulis alkaliphilus]|uniref:Uncharacterized protein n=1 Tax=Glycocaulis alkaliphilus TaxID=1434191 RepID=A0A3T0ECR5_9PROT|nr:hypothetical protein [Glycocaulis alkaliphilus]AZU05063.1 hypothetical protein X907_2551 [Glycocaulis alkaliphilus]GGB65526.1 hypothetical protein GCM10007417_01570 [Glycocaulis alkaliphilus]
MDDSPLAILAILAVSALAVGALIVFNRLIGGWQDVRFEDASLPSQRLEEDVVGFRAGEGVIAADGLAALVMEEGEARLGLVLARSSRCVTRVVRPGEIARLEADGARFHIHFNDFTLPRVTIDLDDASAQGWGERMRRFVRQSDTQMQGEGHARTS